MTECDFCFKDAQHFSVWVHSPTITANDFYAECDEHYQENQVSAQSYKYLPYDEWLLWKLRLSL